MRQADPDFWGYLSSGKLFVERGGLTARDPFAYTAQTSQWMTFEYGADLVLWCAYRYGGPIGLIALKSALGGAALLFLYKACRVVRASASVWVPIFLLCASALSRFFLFRPQLFTFAFFALFVFVLFSYLLRGRGRLWVLPLVMVLWANTHGGFVAGLGAVGLAILLRAADGIGASGWDIRRAGRATRALWVTLAACTLATLVNPLGIQLWRYVITELTHGTNRRYISEWSPASFSTDPWSTAVLTLLALAWVLVGAAALGRRRHQGAPMSWCWALSCLPLIALSFLSVRHVPLAAIWTGPVVVMLGSQATEHLSTMVTYRRIWFVLRGLALVPACLTCAVVYAQPRPEIRTDGRVLGRTHPCRAVEFLRSRGVQGRVYNPLWWGSYVTWQLYPEIRVSMDGRNISLYPDAMVLENLKFFSDPASAVDIGAPLRYDSDLLLVPMNSPVLPRIAAETVWRKVYGDRDAVVFERSDRPALARDIAAGSMSQNTCSGILE
jgi:hypothetical protein